MADESVNEPRDPIEVRLSWLKQQVTDINRNVKLLMAALRNKLEIFEEYGGSNVEDKSEGGSGVMAEVSSDT